MQAVLGNYLSESNFHGLFKSIIGIDGSWMLPPIIGGMAIPCLSGINSKIRLDRLVLSSSSIWNQAYKNQAFKDLILLLSTLGKLKKIFKKSSFSDTLKLHGGKPTIYSGTAASSSAIKTEVTHIFLK